MKPKNNTKFSAEIISKIISITTSALLIVILIYLVRNEAKSNLLSNKVEYNLIFKKIETTLSSDLGFIEKKQRLNLSLNSFNRRNNKVLNLVEILEDYVFLKNIKLDTLSNNFNIINSLIYDYNKEEPYSSLTPEQSKTFKNLYYSMVNTDISLFNQNLNFLSETVNRLNIENRRIKSESDKRYYIAIIGIIFSLITFFAPMIKALRKKYIIKRDVSLE